MTKKLKALVGVALVGTCSVGVVVLRPTPERSRVSLVNATTTATRVYFAFGADSVVRPAAWSFCEHKTELTCDFVLKGSETRALPLGGKYLNTTLAFGAPVNCGSTKAELNANNPKWYDVADVSLVDGYSNKVAIDLSDGGSVTRLGPPNGASGNEKVVGVFPLGCDVCTARLNPPCGMTPGTDGCKAGTQYKPDVPCQVQGSAKGGGSTVVVTYSGT